MIAYTDPASRDVLGDWREERGMARVPLWARPQIANADAAARYADAYAYAYAHSDADTAANATAHSDANAYAHSDAYADAYANAHSDADTDANAHSDANANANARKRLTMRDGLYAVSLSQQNQVVLRVGWFRRDPQDPDEYEVTWCTPYRGEYNTKLSDVWAQGPTAAPNWKWGPPLESVAHRFHFHPLARLDPEKWTKICPRPSGWEAQR